MAVRIPIYFDTTAETTAPISSTADSITIGGISSSEDIVLTGGSAEVTGLPATPSGATAATSKAYVDSLVGGLRWKEPVRAKAQGNITLSGPGATIDGVSMSNGDRFAAFLQTTTTEDGIYIYNGAASAATRATDFAATTAQANAAFFVSEGTVDADVSYVCTDDAGSDVVGTDDLTVVAFSGASSIPDATSGSGGAVKGKVTFDSDKGLAVTAGVAEARIDAVTLDFTAGVMGVTGVPSLFEVNGVAVGATVTAANLDTLTDGSNADLLHVHAASTNDHLAATHTTADALSLGDPVYHDATNDQIGQADVDSAAANIEARIVGISDGAYSAAASATYRTHGTADITGLGFTAGQSLWAAPGGGMQSSLPAAASGDRAVLIGFAISATQMHVHILDFGIR